MDNRSSARLLNHQDSPHKSLPIDWSRWLVRIERKRRMLVRLGRTRASMTYLLRYISLATLGSFRMEKIEVTESQVREALVRKSAKNAVRGRLSQRIRNHAAILLYIESLLRSAKTLTTQMVMRWYTSISNGLSTSALDQATMDRLDFVVRRINSPRLRLQPALGEVARLHMQLISDPFVPGFNGILARLLLEYHIGRCGLPRVLIDATDQTSPQNENRLLSAILDGVDASFDRIAADVK